jgi:hypothetical protein
LVGKPERKRPLGIPKSTWGDKIKIDLQELGCECVDWMKLTQDRDRWWALANAVMILRFSMKCGEFLDWLKTV